jgi:uncharacterized coiled-coil protein SlyX
MDRTTVNTQNSLQVTLEDIVVELNKQIASLNFELTASRLAIQKLQNALQDMSEHTHENDHANSKINTETF